MRLRLVFSDALVVSGAVAVAYASSDVRRDLAGAFAFPYTVASVVLALLWIAALARSHDRRTIGSGNREYQSVVSVSWRLFAAIGLSSFLLKVDTGRSYLAIAFVLGVALLLVSRFLWRKWLHRKRAAGLYMSKVLVVGPHIKAVRLCRELTRNTNEGYSVAGICLPEGSRYAGDEIDGIPVLGDFSGIGTIARAGGVDLVAVSGADSITSEAVQSLGWDLEGSGVDISVTLAMADVAGPRFLLHPASTLPLVFVDEPEFSGMKYALKSAVDWLAAALLIVILAPVLACAAIAVKVSSNGPVIYRQQRIGRNEKGFHVYKFRSMFVNADSRLEEVMTSGITMFYKRHDDPRITPVGRFLRRYSIDELPQLFNVIRGDMSLVGPRPQIDKEVALYDRRAYRRLLVKPGLTGLWQVSGRSTLSPEDSIRLDVYYVENWTLFGDLLILARTIRAVVSANGAM